MSGLRIISGKAKGRKLRSVPGETTRPITDKVREALFNIIGPDIEESKLLDLFAGTGSVGIEALSRGASYVLFIDKNRQPVVTIKANLKETKLEKGAEVIHSDGFKFLEKIPDRKFDYVYVAPPQFNGLWKQAILAIENNTDWLSKDAWVIAQIHPVEYERLEMRHLTEFDLRSYGSTMLVFYQMSEEG